MEDLFSGDLEGNHPLARRMRPRTLDEFKGQNQILGRDKPLRRLIEAGSIASAIFYGPPGTGKTALAHIIAGRFEARFEALNAVTASVSDIRRLSGEARERLGMNGTRTLLFIDELHRFNKLQQDALLPDIEDGIFVMIGATTENPSFYIVSPLASRTHLFEFVPLTVDEIVEILEMALTDGERGLGRMRLEADGEALRFMAAVSDGDARRALNMLEVAAMATPVSAEGTVRITEASARSAAGRKAVLYDRDGDSHYDCASAFIKSMRGSDPDAAVYYLARMIEGGEDPRFIARRMAIFASEDIGNADPTALILAAAAHEAVSFVGMPEARIILAQAATYLASAVKSNASYAAVDEALSEISSGRMMEVPLHLRGTGYRDAERLGRGDGYIYPHTGQHHFVRQEYLPEPRSYYRPDGLGAEKRILERLRFLWGSWPREEGKKGPG